MSMQDMQVRLEALVDDVRITEQRQEALDLDRQRLVVDHSLLLHRDKASADDIRAMIDHLANAGMPGTATLKMDGSHEHTRMYARWSTDPIDGHPIDDGDDAWPEPEFTAADAREYERQRAIERASAFRIGEMVVRIGDTKRKKSRGAIVGRDAAEPTRFHVKWTNRPTPTWHYEHDLAVAPIEEQPEADEMPEEMPTDGPEEDKE